MVFGVGLEFFFNNDHKHRVLAVMRKRDRVRVPERPGLKDVPYYCESLDYPATERKLSAYLAEFQDVPPEKSKPH